jgi:hypothetical protein
LYTPKLIARQAQIGLAVAAGLLMSSCWPIPETPKTGPDGLPWALATAADLRAAPEGHLYYPGSVALVTSGIDETTGALYGGRPAEIETTLAAAANTAMIDAWYRQQLVALGWSMTTNLPLGTGGIFSRYGKRDKFMEGFTPMAVPYVRADKLIPGDTAYWISYTVLRCDYAGC